MTRRQKTTAIVCIVSILLLNGCEKNIPSYNKLSVAPVIQVADPPTDTDNSQGQNTSSEAASSSRQSTTSSRRTTTSRRVTSRVTSRYVRPASSKKPAASSEQPTEKPTDPEEVKVVSISVNAQNENIYYAIGESFDENTVQVVANMSDKSTKILKSTEYKTDFSSETAGTYDLTVEYEGFKDSSVKYTIARYIVTYTYVDVQVSRVALENNENGVISTHHCGEPGQIWYTDKEMKNEAATPYTLEESRVEFFGNMAESTEFEYSLSDDGNSVQLTRYTGNETDVKIPDTFKIADGTELPVTSLNNDLFAYCHDVIKTVVIPDSVTNITGELFKDCINLEKILTSSTNKNYVSVEDVLYAYDKKTLIAYPRKKSVMDENYQVISTTEVIGKYAFYGSMVNSVNLTGNVKTIEKGAFWDAENLTTIICESIVPPDLDDNLENSEIPKITLISVPAESLEDYKKADYWNVYKDVIQED